MGWATKHIEKLQDGRTVLFRPSGNSMSGRIESGQLVTVVPATGSVMVGDIVLCKVGGQQLLHLVTKVVVDMYEISNNHGKVNGLIPRRNIFGKVTKVED